VTPSAVSQRIDEDCTTEWLRSGAVLAVARSALSPP
jgi:hypothetical protein